MTFGETCKSGVGARGRQNLTLMSDHPGVLLLSNEEAAKRRFHYQASQSLGAMNSFQLGMVDAALQHGDEK